MLGRLAVGFERVMSINVGTKPRRSANDPSGGNRRSTMTTAIERAQRPWVSVGALNALDRI
ncbi:MAG: hypothetical protein KAQ88_11500, partial [Hyphomicrobiaceae bacterium]|nr:hypothetical protein [Hyphomicrobiaceae bacterium]